MLLNVLLLSYVTLCTCTLDYSYDVTSDESSTQLLQLEIVEDQLDELIEDQSRQESRVNSVEITNYLEFVTVNNSINKHMETITKHMETIENKIDDKLTKMEEIMNALSESVKIQVNEEARNLKTNIEKQMKTTIDAVEENLLYIKSYTDNVIKSTKDKYENEIKKCNTLMGIQLITVENIDKQNDKIDSIATQLNQMSNDLKDIAQKTDDLSAYISKTNQTYDQSTNEVLESNKNRCNTDILHNVLSYFEEGNVTLQGDFSDAKIVSEEALHILNKTLYNTTQLAVAVQSVNDHMNGSIQILQIVLDVINERCQIQWVNSSYGGVPPNAIPSDESNTMYIGRALHDGDLTPGKIIPNDYCLYVPYHQNEYAHESYQVLTGCNVKWFPTSGGTVIPNAIQAGYNKNGVVFYICRVEHEGQLVIGKVHLIYGACYIPYAGLEISYNTYDILIKEA